MLNSVREENELEWSTRAIKAEIVLGLVVVQERDDLLYFGSN